MTLLSSARELAATFGLHVTRLSQTPDYSLLGMRHVDVRTVIDVGANEGQFARYIRPIFRTAKIYSFEPIRAAHAKLNTWASSDGNAVAVNCALGETAGTLDLHLHVDHTPSSSLLRTTAKSDELYPKTMRQETETIKMETMDGYFAQHGGPPAEPVFMKLDVQGFERAVLLGAKETLKRTMACTLEVFLQPVYEGQSSFIDLANLMHEAGFRYAGNIQQVPSPDGQIVYLDAMFVRD